MSKINHNGVVVGQQQPVVIPTAASPQTFVQQQERPSVGEKYKNIYKRLGITQICFGSLSIVLGTTNIILAAASGYYGSTEFIAAGIWCGAMILTCGILGKISSKKPDYCPIIAAMVLSIVTCLACVSMLSIEIAGAVDRPYCYDDYFIHDDYYYCSTEKKVAFVIHVILAAIGLASLITAIVHSAFCCKSVCCGYNSHQQTHYNIYYTMPAPNHQQATQFGANCQYTVVPQVQPTVQGTEALLATETPPAYAQCQDQKDEVKVPL